MTDHTMRGDMIELYKLFNGGYDENTKMPENKI